MPNILRIGVGFLTILGASCVGIGLLALLDSYSRYIGVALGYPPLWSGSIGFIFLIVGIGCLIAARQAIPGHDPSSEHDPIRTKHD